MLRTCCLYGNCQCLVPSLLEVVIQVVMGVWLFFPLIFIGKIYVNKCLFLEFFRWKLVVLEETMYVLWLNCLRIGKKVTRIGNDVRKCYVYVLLLYVEPSAYTLVNPIKLHLKAVFWVKLYMFDEFWRRNVWIDVIQRCKQCEGV